MATVCSESRRGLATAAFSLEVPTDLGQTFPFVCLELWRLSSRQDEARASHRPTFYHTPVECTTVPRALYRLGVPVAIEEHRLRAHFDSLPQRRHTL
jgi:hypothetical protein